MRKKVKYIITRTKLGVDNHTPQVLEEELSEESNI